VILGSLVVHDWSRPCLLVVLLELTADVTVARNADEKSSTVISLVVLCASIQTVVGKKRFHATGLDFSRLCNINGRDDQ